MKKFNYNGCHLSYREIIKGPKTMLTFHGFGQDHSHLLPVEKAFPEHTIYHFDLFFHGSSFLSPSHRPLEKKMWIAIMNAFLKEKNIKSYSLISFSMGSKFALALAENQPKKVDALYLLAPDGIKISYWYIISVFFIRKFFRYLVFKPFFFKKFILVLYKTHLMDKKILRFSKIQMSNKKKRWRVYQSWINFRKINFNQKSLINLFNHDLAKVHLFTGTKDKIIPSKKLMNFADHLNRPVMILIDSNHHNLIGKTCEYLTKELKLKEKKPLNIRNTSGLQHD